MEITFNTKKVKKLNPILNIKDKIFNFKKDTYDYYLTCFIKNNNKSNKDTYVYDFKYTKLWLELDNEINEALQFKDSLNIWKLHFIFILFYGSPMPLDEIDFILKKKNSFREIFSVP